MEKGTATRSPVSEAPFGADRNVLKPADYSVASSQVPESDNKYRWIVVLDMISNETDSTFGQIGPRHGRWKPPVKSLISQGQRFRLSNENGEICYQGFILGEYTGHEPLHEFGEERGCVAIHLECDSQWVAVDAPASL